MDHDSAHHARNGGMIVSAMATRVIGFLLACLTIMGAFVSMAFNRWADAVDMASQRVVDEVAEVREEIRGELSIQRNRLDNHLRFSTDRVQDYESRLRVLENEMHRHRNGKTQYREALPVED